MSGPTQMQMLWAAHRKLANQNETFMEMVAAGLTAQDLARLIERRPTVYGRFAGWLSRLPVEGDRMTGGLLKMMTPKNKEQIRKTTGGRELPRPQMKALVRVYRRHGEPKELMPLMYGAVGLLYPWSLVGIEENGYIHT